MVKVKILKYVGKYEPGQIVEVSEEEAKQLLIQGKYQMGDEMIVSVRAVKLEDFEASEVAAKDLSSMSQGEAEAMGIKNVVETPKENEPFFAEQKESSEDKPKKSKKGE